MEQKSYIAIDLKSFYASVECVERGLDPLDINLVVADESRTDKTICLAATPAIKSFGVSGRSRLFEVKQRIAQVNNERRRKAPGRNLNGASSSLSELNRRPELAVDFMIAPPRMAYYMKYSTQIYSIYLKYVAPEDIIVYSIDEVFMDVTGYLKTYGMTARELAMKIILDVLHTTGITATAGIGTNLFLCKVALDIVAKHIPADENGVRIAELDEMTYTISSRILRRFSIVVLRFALAGVSSIYSAGISCRIRFSFEAGKGAAGFSNEMSQNMSSFSYTTL